MRRWMFRLKRVAICLCIPAIALAACVAYTSNWMAQADKQHKAFCDCGTSIKGFLSSYASAIRSATSSGDVSALRACYADDYSPGIRGHFRFEQPNDLGDVTLSVLTSDGSELPSRDDVVADLQCYLEGIASIDDVKYKINLIEAVQPEVSAVLTVKCVLDGRDTANQLFQDRLFFRWHIEIRATSKGAANWRIVRDELVEGVRVAGRGNAFERANPYKIGIDYVHRRDPKLDPSNPQVHLKFAVIEHAAGGVSAADFDADSRADLFFCDGVASRLFRNVTPVGAGEVAFEDVTRQSGLGGLDQACSAMFGDFDNDGDKDLFVSRYAAGCKYYINDGAGHFVDATLKVGLDQVAPCVSSCLLDYDQDGFLDIYVGGNGNAFKEAPDIPFYATNGQHNRLLRNDAGQRFIDVTRKTGIGNSGWTLAVTAGDYDNDGNPDLAVANDFGRKVLYHNNGNGTFADRAKESGVLDFSGGMGVAFADLNHDDAPDLLTSNIESGQRYFGEEITLWQSMRNEVRSGWIWHDLPEYRELYTLLGDKWRDLGKQVGEGNSVYCNQGNGTFVEWKDCHATRAGWAWSVNPLDQRFFTRAMRWPGRWHNFMQPENHQLL